MWNKKNSVYLKLKITKKLNFRCILEKLHFLLSIFKRNGSFVRSFYPLISKNFNVAWLKNDWFFRYGILIKFDQLQILHPVMYKLYHFGKVDFRLTVRMRMRNYGKLDHTQTTYLWFPISLHIHKTDFLIKMRLHLSAYSITLSARCI